jgi:SEC-C motif domain protein
MSCACGSGKEYSSCCEPLIQGKQQAKNPEELMRSRYTAHVKKEISYIRNTLAPEQRSSFIEKDVLAWAQSEWLGLEIIEAKGNKVEFIAKYKSKGKVYEHHEYSTFRKIGEKWYFVDGDSHVHEEGQGHHHHHHAPQAPIVREEPKVGRNDPCVCGSGKKYKKCCGAAA